MDYVADKLTTDSYYTNIGVFFVAEFTNNSLDTLNFGRDIAEAIYLNDGDWLDKGAAMAPDFMRGATILMTGYGIAKAVTPSAKINGFQSAVTRGRESEA